MIECINKRVEFIKNGEKLEGTVISHSFIDPKNENYLFTYNQDQVHHKYGIYDKNFWGENGRVQISCNGGVYLCSYDDITTIDEG